MVAPLILVEAQPRHIAYSDAETVRLPGSDPAFSVTNQQSVENNDQNDCLSDHTHQQRTNGPIRRGLSCKDELMPAETTNLNKYLTEEQMVALAENFGGTRLYVPAKASLDHDLVKAIGMEGYKRLADAISPDVIRVPLCREIRASHYRESGLSNGKIATRLGMTEAGVNKLFKRMKDRSDAPPTQRP